MNGYFEKSWVFDNKDLAEFCHEQMLTVLRGDDKKYSPKVVQLENEE